MGESETRSMSGLLKVLVLCIVGLAITPSINAQTVRITASGSLGDLNLTLAGSTRAIISLFPMFWVILMIAIPVAYISMWMKT